MSKKKKGTVSTPKPKIFTGMAKPTVYGPRVNPTKRSAKAKTKTGG